MAGDRRAAVDSTVTLWVHLRRQICGWFASAKMTAAQAPEGGF